MDPEALRSWLLLQPRPTRVVVLDANADRHELEVKAGATWKSVAESLIAMAPEKLEAYDGAKLVRAKLAADLGGEQDDEEEDLVVADPESQRLIVFGRLLAEAYQHANHEAFETLARICDSAQQRTQALEEALRSTERIMMRTFEDSVIARARAESGEGGDGDMLGTLVRGMVKGAVDKDAKGTNGANGAGGTS